MKKKLVGMVILLSLVLAGCRESSRVSHNVSREADSFGVVRRVTVINMRSDELVFEVIGNISIDTSDQEKLVIIAETEEGTYKKHYINMTEWNMYVVEDIGGADVSNYQYEVNYLPEMVVPFEIITE